MALRNRLWAVGGGKGGVGKSIVSLLVAEALARRGVQVVLVDADLGGSNLHTLLGMRQPEHSLADFMERRVEQLADVAAPTIIPNLRLIYGADDILGIANPKYSQKTRLLTHLERLAADVILLDLGAGTSSTTTDFFLYAAGKIVVVTPQVTSIQNAYGFVKASLYRKLTRVFTRDAEALALIGMASNPDTGSTVSSVADLRKALEALDPEYPSLVARCLDELDMSLVVNMVRTPRERESGQVVRTVAQKYLDLSPEPMGWIDFDPEVDRSINNMAAFLTSKSRSAARMGVYDVATKILRKVQDAPRASTEPIFEPEDDPATV
jgi:flagellar biosynthesis protein FlhG